MAEEKKGQVKRKRFLTRRRLGLALLLVLLGFVVGQGPLISWGLRKGLEVGVGAVGWELVTGEVDAGIFHPWQLRDLRIRSDGTYPSDTDLMAGQITIAFEPIWDWFRTDGRVFRKLEAKGLDGLLDFRPGAMPVVEPKERSEEEQQRTASIVRRFLPRAIEFTAPSLAFLAKDQAYRLETAAGRLSEARTGELSIGEVIIEADPVFKRLRNLNGITAWKDGVAYLFDGTLAEDVTVRRLAADFINPGGVSMELELDAFGGSLRGGIDFGTRGKRLFLDASVSAYSIRLEELIAFSTLSFPLSGQLDELRVVFRGFPEDPASAQAMVRLKTEAIQLFDAGWDSLEVGADLANRQVRLPEILLHQGENRLKANAEIKLPQDLSRVIEAPLVLNVAATIPDAAAFFSLLGPQLEGIQGRLYLHGSINGRGGEYDGYLNGEALDLLVRGVQLDSGRFRLLLHGRQLEIASIDFLNGEDSLQAAGELTLQKPYVYHGRADLSVVDLSAYLAPFAEQLGDLLLAGGLEANWQGDGSLSAHSGAFSVRSNDFTSDVTPGGLSAEIVGTYAPGNVYLSSVDIQRYTTRLTARGGFSEKGVSVDDLLFRASQREIASGYFFLPVDLFRIIGGQPLSEAFLEGQQYRISFQSKQLDLSELMQLAGQEPLLDGTLTASLQVGGEAFRPEITGKVEADSITVKTEGVDLPPASLSVSLGSKPERLELDGRLTLQGFDPVTLEASAPFSFREEDRRVVLRNPTESFDATATFPRTSLKAFKAFFPKIHRIDGTLSGQVRASGSVAAPKLEGSIQLTDGLVEVSTRLQTLRDLNAEIRLAGTELLIDDVRGTLGAGPFSLKGKIDIANPGEPAIELELEGRKVLFVRNPGMRLRANLDVSVKARGSDGAVSGSVELVDGRIYQRLEILPLLAGATAGGGGGGGEGGEISLPSLRGLVPPPAGDWKLDIDIRNASPFTVGGNIASGEIVPEVNIGGTLGNIVPVGDIQLNDVQAFLPFTVLQIPKGHIYFTKENPGMPILDIRGTAQAQQYDVFAYAYGPLTSKQLVLRSDPPLPQESIVLLLTTGIAPGANSGSQLGQVAVGQGGLLLLRTLLRQFDRDGVNSNALINRIRLSFVPPLDPTERNSTIRGEFRLTDDFSLATERDGFGFYSAGVIYTFRFR